MTKPRPWPNNAMEARDRAAEETQDALNLVDETIREYYNLDHSGRMQAMAIVARHLTTALRHLESVGAETRPT